MMAAVQVFCRRFWWYAFLACSSILFVALPFKAARSEDEGPLLRMSGMSVRAGEAARPRQRRASASSKQRVRDKCPAESTTGEYGPVHWPATEVGKTSKKECPYGPCKGQIPHGIAWAYRSCVLTRHGATWFLPDFKNCANENCDLECKAAHAEEDAREAAEMTSVPENIDSKTFLNATSLIDKAFKVALVNETVGGLVLRAMSNLVATPAEVMQESDADGKQLEKLYLQMEEFGSAVVLKERLGVNISSVNLPNDNLHLVVHKLSLQRQQSGCSLPPLDAGTLKFTPTFACEGADGQQAARTVELHLPTEAMDQALGEMSGRDCSRLRLRFMAVRNANLLRPPGLQAGQQCVISASLSKDSPSTRAAADNDISVRNLREPVRIQMAFSVPGVKHVCAYYNLNSSEWLVDGLQARPFSREQDSLFTRGVNCESTHLTPFTLLLDPYPRRDLGPSLSQLLDIVGYVGSGLSVAGLLATIITYQAFRVGGGRWGRVLVQLCASLLLLHVAYLASNLKGSLHPTVCMSVAILVHAFLLSTFCWMFVEALLLYQLLVTVFEPASTKFMLKRLLAAWGLPVVLVAGCAGMDPWYYIDTHPDYCVTSATNQLQHILFVLVPCCVVMAANLLIFIRVAVVLLRRRTPPGHRMQEPTDQPTVTWAQLRGVIGVAFLLGVTWPLSPLAASNGFMQLSASVCNSLQGVVIFLTRVVNHQEVRRSWRKCLGQCCQRLLPGSREFPSSATYAVSNKKSIWSRLRWSAPSGAVASFSQTSNTSNGTRPGYWNAFWNKKLKLTKQSRTTEDSKSTSELSSNSNSRPPTVW